MKAVILAGGEDDILRPLVLKRPKALVPILDKFCIDYVLSSLARAGIREVIITTSYMPETIVKAVGDGSKYKMNIVYSFEQKPLGTAGAVKKVASFIDDETFIVASGDILADMNINSLYNFHREKGAKVTIALATTERLRQYGIVAINEIGRVIRFKEKPKTHEIIFSKYVNAGIYILEPEVLDYIRGNRRCDFALHVFPKMLDAGELVYGTTIDGLWLDLGRPADLLKANREVASRLKGHRKYPGLHIEGKLIIGENTRIETGCKIRGTCFIGKNCGIGRKTVLENAYILDNVWVDQESYIRNSIVMSGSKIGWRCKAKESIISENSILEDDVKIHDSVLGDNVHIRKHVAVKSVLVDPDTVMEK